MKVFKDEMVKSTGKKLQTGEDIWLEVSLGSGNGWAIATSGESVLLAHENSAEAKEAIRQQSLVKFQVLSDRSCIREQHDRQSDCLARVRRDDTVKATGEVFETSDQLWIEVLYSNNNHSTGWVLVKDGETLFLTEEDSPAAQSTMDDSLRVNEVLFDEPESPLTPNIPEISLSSATSSPSSALGQTAPQEHPPPSVPHVSTYSEYAFPVEDVEDQQNLLNRNMFGNETLLRLSAQGREPAAPPLTSPGASPRLLVNSNMFGNATLSRLRDQGALPLAPPLSPDSSSLQIPRPPETGSARVIRNQLGEGLIQSEPASMLQTEYTGSTQPSPIHSSGFGNATLIRLLEQGVAPDAPLAPHQDELPTPRHLLSANTFGAATFERLREHGVAPAAPPALAASRFGRRHAQNSQRFSAVSADAPASARSSIVRGGSGYMDLHLDLDIDSDILSPTGSFIMVCVGLLCRVNFLILVLKNKIKKNSLGLLIEPSLYCAIRMLPWQQSNCSQSQRGSFSPERRVIYAQ